MQTLVNLPSKSAPPFIVLGTSIYNKDIAEVELCESQATKRGHSLLHCYALTGGAAILVVTFNVASQKLLANCNFVNNII